MSTRLKRQLIVLAIATFSLVAIRGFVIARLLNGVYRLNSLVFDCVAALAIVLVLQGLDRCYTAGLTKLIGDETSRRKFVVKAFRLTGIVLVFGTFLLATIQMHPPKVGCRKSPADFGIAYSQHTIETIDGLKLSAWSIPAADTTSPVVVMTHGLGSNKQDFLPVANLLHRLNYNVVAFDFRGHGDSDGHTCSLGVNEGFDVKSAYDLACMQFPNRPVYAWSTSMGAAATLRASAEYQVFDKLVVDASYSSIKSVAMETKYCYLGPLAGSAWNLSRLWFRIYVGKDIDQFVPEQDIASLSDTPVFLVHGTADNMIPDSEASKLREASSSETTFWLVEGAGHSMSFRHPDYAYRIRKFYDHESTTGLVVNSQPELIK